MFGHRRLGLQAHVEGGEKMQVKLKHFDYLRRGWAILCIVLAVTAILVPDHFRLSVPVILALLGSATAMGLTELVVLVVKMRRQR
jgi:ribose/xylose/arabinose/galactoside ABC-type transport system permease subunit